MAALDRNLKAHINTERASNHKNRYKFSLSGHLDAWEVSGNKICVYHHVVDGVLVRRELLNNISDHSPYFFMDETSKQSCIIARIYDATLQTSSPGWHQLGAENMHGTNRREHIFILKPGMAFDEFDEDAQMLDTTIVDADDPDFIINMTGGGNTKNEVQFSYKYKGTQETEWVPIWYFYKNGEFAGASLEESPEMVWPDMKKAYDAMIEDIRQRGIQTPGEYIDIVNAELKLLLQTQRENGNYAFLRLYKNGPDGETDIGKPKSGGQPPP